NPRFLGHDNVLDEMHRRLKPFGPTGIIQQQACVAHGIGGVGKTQLALALEYTYRFRYEYTHVFWIRAESNLELATSFGTLARDLMPTTASQDQNRNIELVRDWLVRSTPLSCRIEEEN
ncbi:hypothetical protein DL98DRAFT_386144, partial [Cadophora sp. DSE1049]